MSSGGVCGARDKGRLLPRNGVIVCDPFSSFSTGVVDRVERSQKKRGAGGGKIIRYIW